MEENQKIVLPHHVQQKLCTTRLPYRQGRKLTAVKVYSITKESNHLLIFGVPSLKLRQETKGLFAKFGKLLQFNISNEHVNEAFTETYHVQYEKIQSARLAKRMLDTKNFYGGSLHVTYAPELETIEETQTKLIQRQLNVINRLKNLKQEDVKVKETVVSESKVAPIKLNMGEINTIPIGPQIPQKKKKKNKIAKNAYKTPYNNEDLCKNTDNKEILSRSSDNKCINESATDDIDVIDCTNIQNDVITNIDEGLNYNKFGNEHVKTIPGRALNKIKFHINKKS